MAKPRREECEERLFCQVKRTDTAMQNLLPSVGFVRLGPLLQREWLEDEPGFFAHASGIWPKRSNPNPLRQWVLTLE
ncbi:hypothetical protein IWQ48_006092 [Labrenzia sp. EL_13]|nr:hypothetical protein [Labrenzia sp. EL_142]MBG6159945.1 hypothetical protein [Labrenzia sp. EL_162]MBG6198477.1 hypothetical protein [Labrenzia sp. EL_159]MBG6204922.1 hypothetical protein [Labrenzia sp. EL_13]